MHNKVFKYLDELGINYTNHTHEPVFTVEQAKNVDNCLDTMPTKNLFLKDKKKNYFLLTVYAHEKVCIKTVCKLIGAKGGVSFAKPEDLFEFLQLEPGHVTPFGLINAFENDKNLTFFLQNKLFEADTIGVHPLRNDMTTIINPKDLQILIEKLNFKCNLLHF